MSQWLIDTNALPTLDGLDHGDRRSQEWDDVRVRIDSRNFSICKYFYFDYLSQLL
jgi:hypothetical protein